jgi:CHASE2 domain-containing sensor protein
MFFINKLKNFFFLVLKTLRFVIDSQLRARSNFYKFSFLTVVLPLLIIAFTKILQPLDLAIYDLGFWLRPTEPTDERIVIVEWDESSIQQLEETTISDDTLSALVEKIQQQQPRIIGLDLYRDIPVLSPRLTDQKNIEAYNSLQELFRSTPNLIGIEKVVEPKINPSKVLKENDRTAASDLPNSPDDIIREAYMFPQIDSVGSPSGKPYFGVVLGYQYLAAQGFSADNLKDYSLLISKERTGIRLKPLKDKQYGLKFLVNWRKGKPSFKHISALEVISDRTPPDFFKERLVLIGNVSASTADRHKLPLNRWQQTDLPWTYGVEIPAQVASSIISAALDRRLLINPISEPLQLALILISVLTIIKIVTGKQEHSQRNLYLVTFVYASILTISLLLCNFISFNLGYWLPIALPLVGILLAYCSTHYYFYRERARHKVVQLEMFFSDLQHSLGNPLNSIASSAERISTSARELESFLLDQELEEDVSSNFLVIISKRTTNIERQVARIERYRQRAKDFVYFGYFKRTNPLEKVKIERLVKEIVTRFVAENERFERVCLQQIYDPLLENALIDPIALEIILENLLDNAFYAVAIATSRQETLPILPVVKVQTVRKDKTIEFSVEDNGVGIPLSLHQKIFQHGVSFKYSQGIGLYLVKEIVSSYQGTISVESQEGQGSKFVFTLPLLT